MNKIIVQLGNYDGSLKNITFMGELLKNRQELDIPGDESQGTQYDLYQVKNGYRVFEKRWTTGQGEKRQNYAKLSNVLSEDMLLERFPLLANEIGIFEKEDLDTEDAIQNKKTVLLAANDEHTRLLPYTLENFEELIELARCSVDQDDVPEDLRKEFKAALDRFGD